MTDLQIKIANFQEALNYFFSVNSSTSHFGLGDTLAALAAGSSGSASWGSITGTLSNQIDLQSALNAKQNIGNYITALSSDVTASGPGSVVATINSVGGSSAVNINAATVQVLEGPSKVLYVNQTQPGSFIPDGSILRPFKTITDAINQISINGDGAVYMILVAGGIYTENITFNDNTFDSISIIGMGSSEGIGNDAPTFVDIIGNITCIANNDTFKSLQFRGFAISGTINLVGASNNTDFGLYGIIFSGCTIYPTSSPAITVKNIGQILFDDIGSASSGGSGVIIENAVFCGFYSTFLNVGSVTITTNNGNNKPNGFSNTSVNSSYGTELGAITIDSGSIFVTRYSRVNGVVNSGTMTSVASTFLSSVSNSGSWIDFNSSFSSGPTGNVPVQSSSLYLTSANIFVGNASNLAKPVILSGDAAITNSGVVTVNNASYTPAVSGDWAGTPPATVKAALDRMADLLKTLNGGSPIP